MMTVSCSRSGRAALLADTLRDPQVLTTQIRRLERWIDTLAGSDRRQP